MNFSKTLLANQVNYGFGKQMLDLSSNRKKTQFKTLL